MMEKKFVLGQVLEKYHYYFQLGMYFSKDEFILETRMLFSELIDDNFWNYAAEVLTIEERVEQIIRQVENRFAKKERIPAFYLTPWTQPPSFPHTLRKHGYSLSFDDAWVVAQNLSIPQFDLPSGLRIVRVSTWKHISTFIETFMSAFGYVSEDVPYGGLPKTYGETLRRSVVNNRNNDNIVHYLAYWNNEPAGVGSLVYKSGIAGLYNLGVKAEFRNKGIGKMLALQRIFDALKFGNNIIFFQSEPGGIVEKFYHDLGFATLFIGECWIKEKA